MVILAKIFADNRLLFVQVILFSVAGLQIYNLIRFVNTTNRELTRFVLSIKNADYTSKFSSIPISHSFAMLNDSFTEIIESFRQAKIGREAQFQFFKMVVKHVEVGIIALSHDQEILLLNAPAKELLDIPQIKYWRLMHKHRPKFAEYVDSLEGESGELLDLNISGRLKNLTLKRASIQIKDEEYVLLTFQDIRTAIERKEVEAWHQLIRILTHEIMNSMTPLVSMTDTMLTLVEEKNGDQKPMDQISEEQIDDMRYSLRTIRSRGKGLLHFVGDYRKLSRIPKPNKHGTSIRELVKSTHHLMAGELSGRVIDLTMEVPDCTLNIDATLIEQVLINLITNAMQALENIESPKIEISGWLEKEVFCLVIEDNGQGIKPDKLSQIFIPFFSTKEEGSGIGLSLSRNIMHLHNGSISVKSEYGKGTSFTLVF